MQHRTERVLIETERHYIQGTLTLPQDGYRSRLSDFLSSSERDFLAVRDATVRRIDDPDFPAEELDFIAVGRDHVVLVSSLEDEPVQHSPGHEEAVGSSGPPPA